MLCGNRYYDDSTGRFLSRDPAQAGENWYAYCHDNAPNEVDAQGLNPQTGPRSGVFENHTKDQYIAAVGDIGDGNIAVFVIPPGYTSIKNGIDVDFIIIGDNAYHIAGFLGPSTAQDDPDGKNVDYTLIQYPWSRSPIPLPELGRPGDGMGANPHRRFVVVVDPVKAGYITKF